MAERLKPILTMGKEAGLLIFDDIDEAFRTFFGLVVRDMQIRLLLGDRLKLTDEVVIRDARRATKRFSPFTGPELTGGRKDAGEQFE